jgi:DNA helicase IV
MCGLIACRDCQTYRKWKAIGFQKLFCEDCFPVHIAKKNRLFVKNPKPLSHKKKATHEAKFKLRRAKNLAKMAAANVRMAQKSARLAAKLYRESKMDPMVFAERKAKAESRARAKYEQAKKNDEARLAVHHPMTFEEFWS